MKTRTFTILALLACMCITKPQSSYAQPSAGLGFGYNFGAGGELIGTKSNNMYNYTSNPSTQSYSEDGVYGSWGQGFDIDGWFEDMLCECFGAGAELSYHRGRNFKTMDDYSYTYPTYTGTAQESYKGGLNSFSISPYIKMQCCDYFGIKPYGKLGLSVNILNGIKQSYERTETDPTGTDVYKQEAKLQGKLSLGLDAAAGFRYNLGSNLNLYGELDYNTSSFLPNKWTLNKYTVNGTDELGTLTTSQKETQFSKSYDSNATTSPNDPSHALATKYASSYFGLRVGVAYDLGAPKAKAAPVEHR